MIMLNRISKTSPHHPGRERCSQTAGSLVVPRDVQWEAEPTAIRPSLVETATSLSSGDRHLLYFNVDFILSFLIKGCLWLSLLKDLPWCTQHSPLFHSCYLYIIFTVAFHVINFRLFSPVVSALSVLVFVISLCSFFVFTDGSTFSEPVTATWLFQSSKSWFSILSSSSPTAWSLGTTQCLRWH